MQEKKRVNVRSTESIISLGKSKRLAAMRESVEIGLDKDLSRKRNQPLFSGDKQEKALQQAREAVRQSIAKIKATYRQSMQNRLFALRFGTDEEINQMTLEKLFNILNINEGLTKGIAQKKFYEG